MKIAEARRKTSKRWRTYDITWDQFLRKLRTPMRTAETVREYKSMSKDERDLAKEAAGGFVAGALDGGQRKTDKVLCRSMLTLDADNASPGDWEKAVLLVDCRMCCYSTHSHTPSSPRLRWIIPTDREMTPDEYPAVARRVASWLGIEAMDPTTYEIARLMYWPTCSKDGEYVFHEQEGEILSVDEVLASYGYGDAWKDVSLWPAGEKEQEVRVRAVQKAGDPTEKPGMVGLFCRTYDVPAVIEEFLADVYTEAGEDRYTYTKGSTAGGAVLYNDGAFLYSNHATDPAGGFSCNAFDLVRIHLFGEQDDVSSEDTPVTKLPSYGAMCRFCASLPAVKRQLAAERAADAADIFADLLDETETGAPAEEDTNWQSKLVLNSKTGECEPTQNNALLILLNDPALKGAFGYDQFAEAPKRKRAVPWRPGERFHADSRGLEWTDLDDAGLRWYMQSTWLFRSDKDLQQALEQAMHANAFHAVREYLAPLEWDGTPRLDTMLSDYFGVEDTVYTRAVSRKWMTAAVARVMNPGCKFDCVLVIVGGQGIGKSTFAAIISKGWYNDSIVDMGSKDGYASLHGNWIIELSELASLKRSDVESVKSFVSKREDTYRAAYARRTTTTKRQCVFFGTTNELEFLRDRTGERRFWPVSATRPLDREGLQENIDQLWAEAKVRYEQNEYLDLGRAEERDGWYEVVKRHVVQDELEGRLLEYLDSPIPANWSDLTPETRRDYLNGDSDLPGLPQATMLREQVCLTEIRTELCGDDRRRDGGNDLLSRRLANIMNNLPGWTKCDRKQRVPGYGIQWVYRRDT